MAKCSRVFDEHARSASGKFGLRARRYRIAKSKGQFYARVEFKEVSGLQDGSIAIS
jgi:hypothetical protein